MAGWGQRSEVVQPACTDTPSPRLLCAHAHLRTRRRELAFARENVIDRALVELLRDLDEALVEIFGEPHHAFFDTRQHESETERGCGWCGHASDDPIHLTDAGIRIEV